MVITEKMKPVFEAVSLLNICTIEQVSRLLGRSEKSVQRSIYRLRELEIVELVTLDRVRQGGSQPNVHRLKDRKTGEKYYQIIHDLMVADTVIWLHLACTAAGMDRPSIMLEPSIFGRFKPDIRFTLNTPNGERTGFVEVDNDTEGQEKWEGKARQYNNHLEDTARLLVVAPTQKRLSWIEGVVTATTPDLKKRLVFVLHEKLFIPSFGEPHFWAGGRFQPFISSVPPTGLRQDT